jgi:hypothetical protein
MPSRDRTTPSRHLRHRAGQMPPMTASGPERCRHACDSLRARNPGQYIAQPGPGQPAAPSKSAAQPGGPSLGASTQHTDQCGPGTSRADPARVPAITQRAGARLDGDDARDPRRRRRAAKAGHATPTRHQWGRDLHFREQLPAWSRGRPGEHGPRRTGPAARAPPRVLAWTQRAGTRTRLETRAPLQCSKGPTHLTHTVQTG